MEPSHVEKLTSLIGDIDFSNPIKGAAGLSEAIK
jgi:hypothetical protein